MRRQFFFFSLIHVLGNCMTFNRTEISVSNNDQKKVKMGVKITGNKLKMTRELRMKFSSMTAISHPGRHFFN